MVDANVIVECKRVNGWKGIRGRCYDIVESPIFEYFISLCIVLNTVLMCLDYVDSSDLYKTILEHINDGFLYIFLLECILKLIAYGPRYYFFVDWNKFDFLIVAISLITISNYVAERLAFNMTVLRIIRVARLLRMIKTFK